jgi:uncharacterized protein (TIGR03086 family)
MEGNEQLAVIIPMLKEVANGIGDDQLGDPTPCVDFTVAGVLDHMTVLATAFAPMFRGELPPTENASISTLTAADGRAQFVHALDELLDAVESPGALDRTIEGPGGPMPGPVFARLVALDGLVHGWDLASSTNQDWRPPQALLTEVDAFARQAITAEVRASGSFAAEKESPDAAGPLLRLMAFTGRST